MKITTKALLVIFILTLTACVNQPAATPQASQNTTDPQGVVAEGKISPIHAANLTFQAHGIVDEIKVKIGDTVKKGDVLARLSNFDLATAQVTAAQLELIQAQQALDTLNRTGGANQAAAWDKY